MPTALELRLLGYGALLAALVALGAYTHYKIWISGREAGAAEKQALWDQDKAAIQVLASAKEAQTAAQEAATAATNKGIIDGLQAKLDSSRAAGADLVGRVHAAEAAIAAARLNPRPGVPGVPGAAGAPGVPGSQGELDAALAAYDAACVRDAVRFDKLQRQVIPQLGTTPAAPANLTVR